jgi:predicted phosphate transport protein (TIGR00153 family)
MVFKSPISRIFGQSPVQPLQQHIEKVYECVALLTPYFNAVFSADWNEVISIRESIARLEGEADKLKKEIRLHMPKGIFLPVSRRDMLEMLTMQDKIANKTKHISGLILGRKMSFPISMQEPLLKFVDRNIAACAQAVKTVNELDELLETGFKGAELEVVENMLIKLGEIESEADDSQIEIRAMLLELESDFPPIDVMFTYKIIESIGDLGDHAQRVGSRLELMLAS